MIGISVARVLELHSIAVAAQVYTGLGGEVSCAESAIGTAYHSAQYFSDPPSPLHLAALVLRNLVSNHCFGDGNKRTAWAVALDVLAVEGLRLDVDDDTAEAFVLGVAQTQADAEVIVEWLTERLIAL